MKGATRKEIAKMAALMEKAGFRPALVRRLRQAAESLNVKECLLPECNRVILRTRRQVYCSLRCSQVNRTRRYRESIGKPPAQHSSDFGAGA